MSIAELDAMPEAQAAELLQSCCGSASWVTAMLTRRPFKTREMLLDAADILWLSLSPADWREAFSHHPRIGEGVGALPQTARAERWSAGEQAGMATVGDSARAELAAVNREYEQRFGYVYLVCAAGKTGEQLLAAARARLQNPPAVELATAAREHQQIMRLRLEKLLG